MISLFVMLTAVVVLSGAVMLAMSLMFASALGEGHRIREGKGRPVGDSKFLRVALVNGTLSVALVYGPAYVLYPYLFQSESTPVWRVVAEGVGILLIYDFGYYLLHRYLLHEWKPGRKVHAVHHTVKNPTAFDSLYMHPLENVAGLLLWWISAVALRLFAQPISLYSFVWAFLLYSVVNVAIHSGLKYKTFPLTLISYLGTRHYKHHTGMKGQNYASVTPLFDMLFRTEES